MPTYDYRDYDKNIDYQKLIDQSVAEGNLRQAAIYEAQRNAKITGEGLNYETTNLYGSYLPSGSNNPYQQMLNDTIAKLGGEFSYDPDQDANYSAYRKAYLREADRTLQDTLGQYSTMTGGIPSTQAVAAASQAADNYKAKVADAIPEMRNQAYSEWLNQQNLGMNQAQLLMSASQQVESSHQNQMAMAMNRWAQLGYADEYVADLLGVAVGTPTTDQSYQNWAMAQQERSDAYTMAMTMLQSYIMPSAEMLAAAGISQEDAQKLHDASKPVYSGGGYSSGGSGTGNSGDNVLQQNTWSQKDLDSFADMYSNDPAKFNALMGYYEGQYNMDNVYAYIYALFGAPPTMGGGSGGNNTGGGTIVRPPLNPINNTR